MNPQKDATLQAREKESWHGRLKAILTGAEGLLKQLTAVVGALGALGVALGGLKAWVPGGYWPHPSAPADAGVSDSGQDAGVETVAVRFRAQIRGTPTAGVQLQAGAQRCASDGTGECSLHVALDTASATAHYSGPGGVYTATLQGLAAKLQEGTRLFTLELSRVADFPTRVSVLVAEGPQDSPLHGVTVRLLSGEQDECVTDEAGRCDLRGLDLERAGTLVVSATHRGETARAERSRQDVVARPDVPIRVRFEGGTSSRPPCLQKAALDQLWQAQNIRQRGFYRYRVQAAPGRAPSVQRAANSDALPSRHVGALKRGLRSVARGSDCDRVLHVVSKNVP